MKKSIISIILVLCMLFPMAAAVGVQAGDASSTAGALDNYSAADAGIDVYTAWYNTANHFTPDGNKKLDVFISAKEDRNKLPSKILVTNLKSNTSYLNAVQAWKYATFNDDTASDIFTDKEKAVYVSLLHDMIMGDDAVSGYNAIVSDTGEKIGETWESISEEGLRDFLNYLLASNLLEKYLGNKNTIEELENLLKTATDAETKQDIANAIDTVQKQNKGMATANAFLSSPVWEKIDIATNIADSALTLFDTCTRLADVYALMNCDQAYFDVMKGISQSSTASDKVRAAAAEIAEVRKNYNIDRSSIMQYVFQNATKDFIIKKTTSAVYDLVLDKIKELFPAFAVWDGARAAGKFCCDFLFDTTDQNAILYSMLALDEIETALYDTTENGWTEFLMNPSVENAQFFNTAMRLIYRYHIASEQYAQQYIDSIYQGGLIPLLFSNKEDYATWTDSLTSFIKVHKIDLYLYDAWVWDTYTTYAEKLYIVYNANGGSNPPTAQMTRYEQDVALTTDIPTRTGYTFLGWSLTDNGTAQYIPGQTYAFETSVTLYAVWEKDTDSTSVPSTFDDAKAMVDFSSTAIGATKGRIRYMTQLTIDTANYVSDYWKYTVNGTTGTLSSSDKCTRCALSMTLSYLGLDYTPGYMSTLANSIDIASPWVTVPDLIPSITRVNGEFDTLFANYSASSDHSPIAVYFDYKHPNDGAIHQHAIVIIGKNGNTYYAVDSAANVTKLVELTFNADKTAIATCSYARYADTSAIKGFAQWKLNGTPDPTPDPTPESYTLSGIIRNATEGSADYGKVVEGVTVTRKAADGTVIDTAVTDAEGNFSFTFTGEKGDYIFMFSKTGFQTKETAAMTIHQTSPSLGAFVIYEEENSVEIVDQGTCGTNLTWTLDSDGTLTISGEGAMKDYAIGKCAPWYPKRAQIKKVIIGDTVTTIGSFAFDDHDQLATIDIPDSVKSIGTMAFHYSDILDNIKIGKSVASIGNDAFAYCSTLSRVYFYGNTPTFTNSNTFNAVSPDLTLYYIEGKSGWTSPTWTASNGKTYNTAVFTPGTIDPTPESYTLSGIIRNATEGSADYGKAVEGVTVTRKASDGTVIDSAVTDATGTFSFAFTGEKGDYIFVLSKAGFQTFTTAAMTIHQTSPSLGAFVIYEEETEAEIIASGTCGDNLTWTLDDAGTLTISGEGAMRSFYSYDDQPWYKKQTLIRKIVLTKGVTSIGDNAFQSPRSNSSNLIAVSIPDSVTSIGNYAFDGCSILTAVSIPDSVTNIGKMCFYGCSSLIEVSISNNVTTIAEHTFDGCSNLTTAAIPDGVTTIDYAAFAGCSSLTTISIPDSVTTIGNSAFAGCSSLTTISIPDSVTTIGNSTFAGCSSLTAVSIPNGVSSIGKSTFTNCSNLTAVFIPDSITSIGNEAFYNCSSLTAVSIPDGVTSIGETAFHSCSSLTIISIPNGVSSIGKSTFTNRSNLTAVFIPDSITSIGDSAFLGCSSLTTVSIPNSVANIGSDAFFGCSSLTTVSIPDSITSLPSWSFANCTSLTSVYFYGNTPTIAKNTFKNTPSSLVLYYIAGKSGWTSPTWTDSNGVTYNTATFTPGAVDPKPTIPGDISGDGVLDYFDVTALYAAYQSGEVDTEVMDVNHDGVVDYYDVSKLYAAFRGTATLT